MTETRDARRQRKREEARGIEEFSESLGTPAPLTPQAVFHWNCDDQVNARCARRAGSHLPRSGSALRCRRSRGYPARHDTSHRHAGENRRGCGSATRAATRCSPVGTGGGSRSGRMPHQATGAGRRWIAPGARRRPRPGLSSWTPRRTSNPGNTAGAWCHKRRQRQSARRGRRAGRGDKPRRTNRPAQADQPSAQADQPSAQADQPSAERQIGPMFIVV